MAVVERWLRVMVVLMVWLNVSGSGWRFWRQSCRAMIVAKGGGVVVVMAVVVVAMKLATTTTMVAIVTIVAVSR